MDDVALSTRSPQLSPVFTQLLPSDIPTAGDNFVTRTGDAATTCSVYAQNLSPAFHRCGKAGSAFPNAVYVYFARYVAITAPMGTLVD